jgi:hypothetical protein
MAPTLGDCRTTRPDSHTNGNAKYGALAHGISHPYRNDRWVHPPYPDPQLHTAAITDAHSHVASHVDLHRDLTALTDAKRDADSNRDLDGTTYGDGRDAGKRRLKSVSSDKLQVE